MLTGLLLLAAGGAALSDIALLQDVLLGAGAGLMGARLMLVALEHHGRSVSDVHRHRLDALWMVGGAIASGAVYMLLNWLYA